MGYSPVQNTSDGKLLGIGFQAFTHGCTTFESKKERNEAFSVFSQKIKAEKSI